MAEEDDPGICGNCRVILGDQGCYTVRGRIMCEYCASKFKGERAIRGRKGSPRGSAGIAVLYGILAAFASAIACLAGSIYSGFDIALMAPLPGLMVGWSVSRGIQGLKSAGGARIAAIGLAYLVMIATNSAAGTRQPADIVEALQSPFTGGTEGKLLAALGLFLAWQFSGSGGRENAEEASRPGED